MVALPTPAFAATASIEIASALCPDVSIAMTASMIASSARALRGRPGAFRSWSVTASTPKLVMGIIVTEPSRLDQLNAPLLGETLGRGGRRRAGRADAGQPCQGDQRADQGDDRGTDRGVVHRA